MRQAAGMAVLSLLKIGAKEVAMELGNLSAYGQAVVEGAVVAGYKFETFRPAASRRKNALVKLSLVTQKADVPKVKASARVGQVLGEATNLTREVGNQPGNRITPATLAAQAQTLASKLKLKCRVWDEPALHRAGFGGILAVGKGSANPPRLIVMEWRGGRKTETPFAVVGKAITFDSGGISLKPGARMDEMKFDKMGGCAVLGIMQAAARLRLPINLVGVIVSAENMPGSRAYRPGDLVETWDGKVIEVLNTDAEGRVVLADALAYVRETYKPRLMIDLATLTGACVVALGTGRAGLFTQDKRTRDQLWELGERTGDLVWPLPMGEEYTEAIKSEIALVKNAGGREGGACTAASFLSHWVEKTPWVHLDIAGTGWITKALPHLEAGATGFGVRLVTEFLRARAKS